ncbi:hypothetical protein DT603_01630 [Pseudoxanthomonas gei]|uniref:Uncharacterized protein n=1 Tax=Pseudoxanthomonas gei TaxID=1383030 RepID=A0ABX0ABA0_9GAMM|nr:hypothetical protein [Pseudoxanthomonas gei]NDK37546.1 hypothetical protein [Pseudoxanthomonas gei]
MPSSTGSQLERSLQKLVDLLWVECVNCPVAERQAIWDRGLLAIRSTVGAAFLCVEMQDALQDAGFRLGIFYFNAQAARFYGAAMG